MPRAEDGAKTIDSAEKTFRELVERRQMIRPGDRVLAAVSGGGDSVLLLHLLIRHRSVRPFVLQVAHLNHGLRGAASDADEAFVRDLSARHALPITSARVDLSRKPGDSSSIEERARDARRAFVLDTARSTGCNRIALGHTLDDQAETVLMWLLRGTGRGGLSGMESVTKDGIIRPLLGLRRQDVRRCLREIGEEFRDDESNDDPSRLRNHIRLRLIPLIEAEFEGAVATIGAGTEILAAEDRYLDEAAGALLDPVSGALRVDLAVAAPEALKRRAVRLGAERAGLDVRALHRDHVDRILELLHRGKAGRSVDLPAGGRAGREEASIVFLSAPSGVEAGSNPKRGHT